MTDQPEAHPAGVYWPGGDQIDDRPSAYWHHGKSGDWAIVKLSSNVTVHVHTRAQARAIIAAFASAAALLPAEDGEDDGEPEPACVRCRSADWAMRRLEHEPGWVCENSGACGRRREATAAKACAKCHAEPCKDGWPFGARCLDICHEALEFDHCCMICATPEEAKALGFRIAANADQEAAR